MRLTCPNCGARYEVDDSLVPPEGRDVQCSNCATTWFQPGPATDMQPQPPAPAPEPEPETTPELQSQPEAVTVYVERAPRRPAPETPPKDAAPAATAPRRELDPSVRDILRAEAEREARLRRGEPDPVETQAEMPLDEDQSAARRARRQAELDAARDAFSDSERDAQAKSGSRRDLLPDIDEINSTLRATADRSPEESTASDIDTLDTGPRRRRGARMGFLFVVLLAALGAMTYSNADLIAAQLPDAAPMLDMFVAKVNEARFWLDDMARAFVAAAG